MSWLNGFTSDQGRTAVLGHNWLYGLLITAAVIFRHRGACLCDGMPLSSAHFSATE